MQAYRRHQLVRLSDAGWRDLLAGPPGALPRWDPQALACLAHWAQHHLPLVVTRQPAGSPGSQRPQQLALGLPAPERWGRRRLGFSVPLTDLHSFDEFPAADAITGLLPRGVRGRWRELCAAFDDHRVGARVCGSYGWQQLTGMACVHAQSDIDLVVTLASADAADAIASLLHHAPFARPRIDGELVFPDGAAVAWREWAPWRDGRAERILVKRFRGASLDDARASGGPVFDAVVDVA